MAYITKDMKHRKEVENLRLAALIFAWLANKNLTNQKANYEQ